MGHTPVAAARRARHQELEAMSDSSATTGRHRIKVRAADGRALTKAQVEKLARAVERGFGEEDLHSMEEVVADHLLEHSSTLGHKDFRERVEMIRAIVADPRFHVDEIVAQGNLVAWRWHITGTHTGKWMGFEPTGKELTLSGISVDRFEDGRSAERWEFPDLVELAAQLEAQKA
jgi:predicted ester cyclase